MSQGLKTLEDTTLKAGRKELFSQVLREKGFRVTPQRECILEVFYNLPEGEHVSAEDLFTVLQERGLDISLATTYRTLKLLVNIAVLRELDFSEDHKHYELAGASDQPPHHHIICVDCGKTAEFDSPEVMTLAEKIAEERGLELVDVQLKVFAKCLGSQDASLQEHESLK